MQRLNLNIKIYIQNEVRFCNLVFRVTGKSYGTARTQKVLSTSKHKLNNLSRAKWNDVSQLLPDDKKMLLFQFSRKNVLENKLQTSRFSI